jgi:ABC-type molybdenum transport system ATPase subunit/photorepair protein PhrA
MKKPIDGRHSAQGSLWHRWDPHLHAPGTVLNDQFGADWPAYLTKINAAVPLIEALGVTDYFCIQDYKAVKARWIAGELPNVRFIFPNVEMRLDIKTEKKKAINLHLLFSPEDPTHEQHIERLLSRLLFKGVDRNYACTHAELIELGRHFNPSQRDDEAAFRQGVNQFKVSFEQLLELSSQDKWFQANCLIAVAGSNNDGTAGLAQDDSFTVQRQTIERFADIIFASTPSQRAYWLGQSPVATKANIEEKYGFLKPCLHGSDGHSERTTGEPAQNRYSWLRGDLGFDTLRQVVLEPERRVWIGEAPPQDGGASASVVGINVDGLAWLATPSVPVNPGFTAIIGSKGSGKTALVEMIAHAAGATGWLSEGSFLVRASEHLRGSSARLTWGDGSELMPVSLDASNANADLVLSGVRYLSQHFVERLCSATGLATELRAELERVVFDATDPTQRMQADSFNELRRTLLEPIKQSRVQLNEQILQTSDAIVQERLTIDGLPKSKEDRDAEARVLENAKRDLSKLIPKGGEVRAKHLAALEAAYVEVSARVEALRRQHRSVEDLTAEVKRHREVSAPAALAALKERYKVVELREKDWDAFIYRFSGDVDAILTREAGVLAAAVTKVVSGVQDVVINKIEQPVKTWPLELIACERDVVKKAVGLDAEMMKRYDILQRQIGEKESTLRKIGGTIESAEGAPNRLTALVERRRREYRHAFDTLLQEEEVLRKLYTPLATQIASGEGALAKMKFFVGRHVDMHAWAKKGEDLLDLRRTSTFRGEGSLLKIAGERLTKVWASGTAEDASSAVHSFFTEFRGELLAAMPAATDRTHRRAWEQSVATWLYDISHIEVQYSVRYGNTAIEKLSPGTRGVVLLLLFLVLDRGDRRPLIVDQPEENLDPHSVYSELVPHFREARTRRQVIVVTHNANLVINTDADQVVVARATPSPTGGMPVIAYECGSLESATIRRAVCDILEGGERAFWDRAKRYRFVLQ